jgi:hypothetical protein
MLEYGKMGDKASRMPFYIDFLRKICKYLS